MSRSKTRSKTYKPRQVKVPGIIDNLPVPPVMLKKLKNDMDNRILRLRFAGGLGRACYVLCGGLAFGWRNGQRPRVAGQAGNRRQRAWEGCVGVS